MFCAEKETAFAATANLVWQLSNYILLWLNLWTLAYFSFQTAYFSWLICEASLFSWIILNIIYQGLQVNRHDFAWTYI